MQGRGNTKAYVIIIPCFLIMFNPFTYNTDTFYFLEKGFSAPRIQSYLKATGYQWESALILYTWNTTISSAFYVPLQGLEVLLRNRLNEQLCQKFGKNWFDEEHSLLEEREQYSIRQAIKFLEKKQKQVVLERIVPELSFGFWISLLRKQYTHTLWTPALRHAFKKEKLTPKVIYKPFSYLNEFRNRIAHHEPIFYRHLEQDYQSIIEQASYLCPDVMSWIDHHNHVLDILKQKPPYYK